MGVTIRESLFQALIDCGECVNLLSYKSAKRLGICEHLRASNVTLAGVSGAKVQNLGSVSLMVEVGDFCVPVWFVVAEVVEDCILGQEFLTKNELMVNFGSRMLLGPGIEVKLTMLDRGKQKYGLCTTEEYSVVGNWVMKCGVVLEEELEEPRDGSNVLKIEEEIKWMVDEEVEDPFLVIVSGGKLEILVSLEGETERRIPKGSRMATVEPAHNLSVYRVMG